MWVLLVCDKCRKQQLRYVNMAINQKDNEAEYIKGLACMYCQSYQLKRVLGAPASHSILTVHGPQKTVEVHKNWQDIRHANKKMQNS